MEKDSSKNFIIFIGGVSFLISAILQIVTLFGPPLAGDIAFLDWVNDRPGYTLFFTFSVLGFAIANIPALIGITHKVHGRGKVVTYLGALTALVGNFFFVILVTEALIQRGMATLEREPMVSLLQWIFETPVYFIPHLLFFLLSYVGMLIITIGLVRAKIASKWFVLFGVLQLITGFIELGPIQPFISSLITLCLYGGIGMILLGRQKKVIATTEIENF
ncbi:hypothetical protein [Fredinandcohnia sp. 179-A 10B2 NHS]|uniref:hypothetical protein n=1 Tax=Fredinandcohnia sp. 179-A 10B2 NHS TaxID=3235176 RepID=UPI0039A33CD1